MVHPTIRASARLAALMLAGLLGAGVSAQTAAPAADGVTRPVLQPVPDPRPAATLESPGLGIGASTSGSGGPPFAAGGSLILEPGLYRCELNRRVVVRRIAPDGQSVVVNWDGKDHTLNAVQARTGALRYEDAQAGLMWLVIVGKSMLLDMRAGRQLANECKL